MELTLERTASGERGAPDDSAWLLPDGAFGSATTPAVAFAAQQVRSRPGRPDAVQPHSTRCLLPRLPFFFLRIGLDPQSHQECMSQECKRHKAVPSAKPSHFILIQSDFSFGLFIAFFDPPSAAGYPHQFDKRGLGWTIRSVICPLARIEETAADEHPTCMPARRLL